MPWDIGKSDRCPSGKPWAVTNSETGKVHGCHPSRKSAIEQQRALYVRVPDNKKETLMDQVVTKAADAVIKPVETENEHPDGEFTVILSKDNLDRDGENLWADEWMTPLPERIHFDTDHAFKNNMSVPYTAGSGVPEITEDGDLLVKGVYADTDHGQLTRRLVNKKHIWQASVAYLEHQAPDGHVMREVLNGTFTGVPANPMAVVTSSKSTNGDGDKKKPYGNVRYADPKNNKYPIDTEEHVRAALSYFGQQRNRQQYSSDEQKAILGRIRSAARRFGIKVSDSDEKALTVALCKAIGFTKGSLTLSSQSNPGRTVANQDVGASSVYDTTGGESDDADDDDDGGGEDVAQAVHDAAVRLGAMCVGNATSKHYHLTLPDGRAITIDADVLEQAAVLKANPGRPIGPYQGVEGMSGENAEDTQPGEPLEPETKAIEATDKPEEVKSVTPADAAAAAKSRREAMIRKVRFNINADAGVDGE